MSGNERIDRRSGKKRLTAVFALVLAAAFASPAFGQSFVGEWIATAASPAGEVSESLKVTKTGDGYAVVAKLVPPPPEGTPEAGPGTDIVLNGDNFSYTRTVAIPGGTLVITYTGVVSGDRFTGKVAMGGFEVPYTGVRTKARD